MTSFDTDTKVLSKYFGNVNVILNLKKRVVRSFETDAKVFSKYFVGVNVILNFKKGMCIPLKPIPKSSLSILLV